MGLWVPLKVWLDRYLPLECTTVGQSGGQASDESVDHAPRIGEVTQFARGGCATAFCGGGVPVMRHI